MSRPLALLSLLLAAAAVGLQPAVAATRTYYLSVDEVQWDYAPAPENVCHGRPYDKEESIYVLPGPGRIGSKYKKAVFRGYSDGTFAELLPHPRHLGILGPPLHAEVGDTVVVVLRNAGTFGGVNFAPNNIAPAVGAENPAVVLPGEVGKYTFRVLPESGPADDSYTSSVMHFYSSEVNYKSALYAGLLGPLIVTRAGAANKDGRPADVDEELITVLFISDENASPYMATDNAAMAGPVKSGEMLDDSVITESNRMHSINGMVFCNLPGLEMALGKRTRWYGAAIGNEADLHTLHWHGNVGLASDGMHVDSVLLLPQSTFPVDFVPENPGRWLGHCHVGNHVEHSGMMLMYDVSGEPVACGFAPRKPTRVREYYIQAEVEEWDYAPQGSNVCDGTLFGEVENIFAQKNYPMVGADGGIVGYGIGTSYVKSRYVQYTDSSFKTKVERKASDAYLGLMGPVLRVRVGEAMKVRFRNHGSKNISMHTHGLFYLKNSEGAP
jgi:Multicopper oxidase